MSARKKILVVGASGQLGSLLLEGFKKSGHEVWGTAFSQNPDFSAIRLDLSMKGAAREIVSKIRPDVCVLSGAMTNVDACELDPERAMAINAVSAGDIAEEAGPGCRVVYLSTEYIFDGEAGPYDEMSKPNPLSVYGKTKLEGERRVLAASDKNLVIRTTVVYSYQPGGKNFIMQLAKKLRSGEEMRIPIDQVSSPTYAPDLASCLEKLVAQEVSGIVNVVGPDLLGRRDFAVRAARLMGLNPGLIQGVLTSALNQKAPRPLKAGLLTMKLIGFVREAPRGIDAGIREFIAVEALKTSER